MKVKNNLVVLGFRAEIHGNFSPDVQSLAFQVRNFWIKVFLSV